ncbi:NHS-like protein 3 [Polymixia lowei]
MSRRSSTGELVPRDVSEILAREARAQRGQKKPGGSLGQAFSWLKGSRRKKSIGNGVNRTGIGAADVKLGYQNHEPSKAGPKGNEDQKRLTVHYRASQHYQENVFIEGSRPQYLEDLHTEAQEGLKILQQEEHKNGVNFPDDESIASTDTLRPEQDISSKDRSGSPEPGSTAGNSVTTATSAASAVSTRPVLTRQGSTFKPLNPVKRFDKSKKKNRRTTIMGIPHQVQRELALHRSSTFQQVPSTQLPNGDGQVIDGQSGVVIIPTIDGETPVANQEGARVHLSDLEQASREEQLLRHHLQAVYQDEQPFSHQGPGSLLSITTSQRPRSLAVPGMTTSSMFGFLQEPQGPVMSISPQATYLSKIIPNAVLPASIEVIQIDRGSSRTLGSNSNHGGSVRTVSKSSLASGDSSVSPVSSRRSDGDGSHTDNSHNNSILIPASASRSNWSQSQSSETIISNTSAVSSKESNGSYPQKLSLTGQERQLKQPGGDQDHVSVRSSVSWVSGLSSKGESPGKSQGSESGASGSDTAGESMRNSRSVTRSLSVMKTKLPPAPPQRTNSLHNTKIRRNSRDLVDIKDPNDSVVEEVEAATENLLPKDETKLVTADISKTQLSTVSNSAGSCSLDDSRSSASSNSFSSQQPSSGEAGGPPEPPPESSNSSPQKTPSEGGKFERTMSPSSGYSSQSGTPTLSPKGVSPTSPDKQKKKPVKPERSGSRTPSSAASASSSLTSLSSTTSEPVNQEVSATNPSRHQQGSPPTVAAAEKTTGVNYSPSSTGLAIRELFNIPPPPKIKAPCPPPPETWSHNRRTFELLCGPCPNDNRLSQLQLKGSTVEQTGTQTDASKEPQGLNDEKLTTTEQSVLPLSESKEKVFQDQPETLLATVRESFSQEIESKECPESTEQERLSIPEQVEASVEVKREEQNSSPMVKDTERQEPMPKKEPPTVMKKTTPASQREELVSTEQSVEGHQQAMPCSVTIELETVEDQESSSQTGDKVSADESEVEMERREVRSMQTLSVEAPKVIKVSPPPSPPPAYHPTPPPCRKTPPSSVSTPPPEELQGVQEEIHTVEACWPPPPPPLEGDPVFDGVDEMDFPPPPPPPFETDSLPDVMDGHVVEIDVPDRPSVALEEVGEKMTDSTETGNAMNGETADIPLIMPQTEVEETRPKEVIQSSKANPIDIETSCRPLQNVSSLPQGVPPPPMQAPPPPPITAAEMSLQDTPLVPTGSVPQPPSTQIEDQTLPEPHVSAPLPRPISVPLAPLPLVESQAPGVTFRRQPSLANRDTRSKELLSRHKSAPIPKEDANIPLVTPSLLQMVRLRSVNMVEDKVNTPSEDNNQLRNGEAQAQENSLVSTPAPQSIPQKPIRKSLSLKSTPQTVKTSSVTLNAPSMRLQEAIRMKTAAMSSRDGLPSRIGLRSSTHSSISESGIPSPKSPEVGDVHKSPASTASFIFSRSTKKVVIETPVASSPEAQASLKHSLAAELMQVSDQSKANALSNGGLKSDKVPPPVAKKPAYGSTNPSQKLPVCLARMELDTEANGSIGIVQPVSQQTPPKETTTTTMTSDTIETLF